MVPSLYHVSQNHQTGKRCHLPRFPSCQEVSFQSTGSVKSKASSKPTLQNPLKQYDRKAAMDKPVNFGFYAGFRKKEKLRDIKREHRQIFDRLETNVSANRDADTRASQAVGGL